MMLISLYVAGLLSSSLYLMCDTESFITASPELIATENDLFVKGYINLKVVRLMTVVLENVTWYEAKEICQKEGFGVLENSTHTSYRQSVISGAFMEYTSLTNISVWTGFYRQNVFEDWMSVSDKKECVSVDLDFDTSDAGYQCAVNRYEVPGMGPKLEMRNCSDYLPFVCRLRLNEKTNFTKYIEYHFIFTPTGASIDLDIYNFDTCLDKCRKCGFCVGFTYNDVTGQCLRLKADFGVQSLEYDIFHVGPNVSHYTKAGIDANIIEESNYIDELGSVDSFVECLSENSTEGPVNASVSFPSTTTTTITSTPGTITPSASETTTSESVTFPTTFSGSALLQTTTLTTLLIPSTTETEGPPMSSGSPSTSPQIFIGPSPTAFTTASSPSTTTSTKTESTSSKTSVTSLSKTSASTLTPTPKITKVVEPKHSTSGTTTSPTRFTLTTDGNPSTSATSLTSTSGANDNNTDCLCTCDFCNMKNNISLVEIKEIVEIIVQNLTIKRKETYSYKSTLECAEDNRTSARAVGFVAAIVMCFVFGPIVISDIFKIARHL